MVRKALKIDVGYDSREDITRQVCRRSLRGQSKIAAEVYPPRLTTLRELGLDTRPVDKGAATEFSLTRFPVPCIAATDDRSVFADCDLLFTADIGAMIASLDEAKSIYVVQHDYTPRTASKMDGQVQTTYPRKNLSSLMTFNGARPSGRWSPTSWTRRARRSCTGCPGRRMRRSAASRSAGASSKGNTTSPRPSPKRSTGPTAAPGSGTAEDVDHGDLWISERDLYRQTAAE